MLYKIRHARSGCFFFSMAPVTFG